MWFMTLAVLGLGMIAQATTIPSPRDVVLNTSQRVLEALKNQQITVADDPEYFYGLADELIVPHFNFRRMSQRVLGKYWHQATDKQRSDFVNQFHQLLVRTYVTALYKYSAKDITNFLQERIKVLPVNYPPEATRVNVKVLVEGQNGGPPINMTLNLYLNKEKIWKVDDVQVEGVSLVTNYRATFYREIHTGGIQGLIDKLASRNQHAITMK
jgi:phospholipid transport system substrate-binding protein